MLGWIKEHKSELKYLLVYISLIGAFAAFYYLNLQGFQNLNSFVDAIYLSAITITTLGYGDITPITPVAKLATGFQAVIGILVIGVFLNAIASKLSKKIRDDEANRNASAYRNSRLKKIQTNWISVLPTVNILIDVSRYLATPTGEYREPEDWVENLLKSKVPMSDFRDFSDAVLSHTAEYLLPGPVAFNHWSEKLTEQLQQLLLEVDPGVFPEIFNAIEKFFELPAIPTPLATTNIQNIGMKEEKLVERMSSIFSEWNDDKGFHDPQERWAKQTFDAITSRCTCAILIDRLIKLEAKK